MSRRPTRTELERLSAYLDGALPASDAALLERALEADPTLRAVLDDLQRVSGQLELEDADFRAAQGIRAAVRDRIGRPAPRAPSLLRRWWWVPAAAATAVLAVAVLRAGGPFGQAPRQVQVQAVAEQYALALNDLGGGQP